MQEKSVTSVGFFSRVKCSMFNNSFESETKADVLLMKHESVMHGCQVCSTNISSFSLHSTSILKINYT